MLGSDRMKGGCRILENQMQELVVDVAMETEVKILMSRTKGGGEEDRTSNICLIQQSMLHILVEALQDGFGFRGFRKISLFVVRDELCGECFRTPC